ncbi:ribosomal protein S18 acetylase RimI-like enzyme [Dyadobacter jejuensis]|uniref:Ribosomal protein S18 acetylase RimI-like enzyme n=1 Tax=Dyadobacter jejuensis TaxID=1082580 RepID=A0A316AMZ1_9BACT|nr:GNAT family N-acetyltransferase [Dyadobacter jejuensis]PWJ58912.1 ribosomal protein S18 acetylase RimI-like enzyme [Dyadobacter jejuensis]
MMTNFSIKDAGIEDIESIIILQSKIWAPTYKHILQEEQLQYMFDTLYAPQALADQMQQGQHFILLFQDQNLVGFASIGWVASHIYKLHKIYVLPSSQGTGAGKFLLQAAESYVIQKGGVCLNLNVNRHNKARGFYERMGYEIIREEDIPIGPYWMNDYVLTKVLA